MDGSLSDFVETELRASYDAISALYADMAYRQILTKVASVFVDKLRSGRMLFFAGNGGSASDAQHIAGEMVSRFRFDRPGLAAVALSTDTAILTAIGNDYGYDQIFARQIAALGKPGDIMTLLSTSGNSPNVLAAAQMAKACGLIVIGMTGGNGGKLAALCDHALIAPSSTTPRIQECHLASYHLLCGLVEAEMFGAR